MIFKFDGLLALFVSPGVLLGAMTTAACWVSARRNPSTSRLLSAFAMLSAALTTCCAAVVGVNLRHLNTSDSLVVLMMMVIPSAWAFTMFATFRVTRIAKAYRHEQAVSALDESEKDG